MSETAPREPRQPGGPPGGAELPASATPGDDQLTVSLPPDPGGAPPHLSSDAEIAARISDAVHEPFRRVWRRYQRDLWLPLRQTLEEAVAAHEQALAGFASKQASADEPGTSAEEALESYQRAVAEDVIEPLLTALSGSAAAAALEESIVSTIDRVRASLSGLPAFLEAPAARLQPAQPPGTGPVRTIKRASARILAPLFRRSRVRRVPVARLARQHLDQVVSGAQMRAFRASQRLRAGWLGRLERAWAAWVAVIVEPALDDSGGRTGQERHEAREPGSAGAALHAELEALVGDISRIPGRESGDDFTSVYEVLRASVAVAGTFAADPPSSRPVGGRRQELARQWDARAGGTAARLELYRSLIAMQHRLALILRDLRVAWAGTVREADALLAEVEAELERGRQRAHSLPTDGPGFPATLESERARAGEALARIEDTLPDPDALFEALASNAEQAIEGLDAIRAGMPEAVALHDLPDPGELARRPGADSRTVRLRETALQAFDTLRRERIRAAPARVRDAMHQARSEVAELREVAGYGYEAAVAELREGDGAGSGGAVTLVANGLVRAANKAAAARTRLQEALAEADSAVAHEIHDGARQLIEQVTADRVTAGYLEARTYLTARIIRGWKRWGGRLAHAGTRVRAGTVAVPGILRRLAASLGLGTAASTVSEPHERTLAHAEGFPHALPVVYRRLFAPEPLTDARLLSGRADALAALAAAWARSKKGDARSLIVIASPGAGVTSFLNVAASRLSREAPDGVRQVFRERIRDEARLASRLADWLGLGEAPDLDALADRVLAARAGTLPRYAVLEAAEHLHLRVPGGGTLVERLLTFMARTESRIFWVVAMTSSAWKLVKKRSPAFADDVERLTLGELSPDELRQAIFARHRLSGLPLRYAEPRDGRAVLRRRTRQLRGSGKQARLIETDYFQRLHRASLGSVRLALFHWLRSADFETASGSLLVQPLRTLAAGTKGLDAARSFALKAILDHGTLSIGEYCDVARASGPESRHLFRSLEDHGIIEEVPDGVGKEPRPGARSGSGSDRYRIRPIMIGAVAAHLRSRNILH